MVREDERKIWTETPEYFMGKDLYIDRKSAMILTMLIVAKNKVLNCNKGLLCAQTISTPETVHFLQRIAIVTQAPKTHFHPHYSQGHSSTALHTYLLLQGLQIDPTQP